MNAEQTNSIGGGWLGTLIHEGGPARPPVMFEAALTVRDGAEGDGGFVGTLLEDEDGGGGEADVSGGQSAWGVRFSQVFRGETQAAVFYEGTLAEDGRTMAGTWRGVKAHRGIWEARRLWFPSEAAPEDDSGPSDETEAAPREAVRLRW